LFALRNLQGWSLQQVPCAVLAAQNNESSKQKQEMNTTEEEAS
jgi:hypothetical protein